ncbi:MAG: O-antigen ligase family protein [Phycisphaerae bacterium]|nr:O-antigen ligase family protein [Phycisphaerae bacterium]
MQPNTSSDLLVDDSPAANRTSTVLALVAAAALVGNCLLNSPPRFSDKHGADTSLLKPVVTLLATGGAFPTVRGVEIRDLIFYTGAAILALVAGLRIASTDWRPRLSVDDLLDIRRRAASPFFWWILLLLVSVVSSMFSHAPGVCKGQTIIRFLHLAWWWPLAALLAPRHVRGLTVALLVVLGATAGLGIWYYVERNLAGTRLQYPIGNELWLAACLLPGVFIAVGLFVGRIGGRSVGGQQDSIRAATDSSAPEVADPSTSDVPDPTPPDTSNPSSRAGSDSGEPETAELCARAGVDSSSPDSPDSAASDASDPTTPAGADSDESATSGPDAPAHWLYLLGLVVVCGAILVALVLTHSRSAAVGLGAGAFALLFFAVRTRTARLVVVLVAMVLATGGAVIVQHMRTTGPMGTRSHSIRTRLDYAWPYALTLFFEKPVAGHGDGSYALLAGQYARQDQLGDPGTISFDEWSWIGRTDNEFLQLLSELGLVGTIAFCAALLVTFYRVLQYCDRARGDPTARSRRWLAIGLAGALLALLAEEFWSPALREPGLPPIFLTVWAALWVLGRSEQKVIEPASADKRLGNFAVRMGGVAAAVCAVILGYFGIQDWRGARARYEADVSLTSQRYAEAVPLAEFAANNRLDPFRRIIAQVVSVWARSGEFQEMLRTSDLPPTDQDLAFAQDSLASLTRLDNVAPSFLSSSRLRSELLWNLAEAYHRRGQTSYERECLKECVIAWMRQRAEEPFRLDIVERLWSLLYTVEEKWEKLGGRAEELLDVKRNSQTRYRLDWLRDLMRNGEIAPGFLPLFQQVLVQEDFVPAVQDFLNVAGQDVERPASQWRDQLSPETFRIAALAKAITGQPDEAAKLAGTAVELYDKAGPRLFAAHAAALDEMVKYGFAADPTAHTDENLAQLAGAQAILQGPVDAARPLPGPLGETRLSILLAVGREEEAQAQIRLLHPQNEAPPHEQLAVAYVELVKQFVGTPRYTDLALRWVQRADELVFRLPDACGLRVRLFLQKGDDAQALASANELIGLVPEREAVYKYLSDLEARYPGSGMWAELRRQHPDLPPPPIQDASQATTQPSKVAAGGGDDAAATTTMPDGKPGG